MRGSGMTHPPPSRLMAADLGHVLHWETEACERLAAPRRGAEGRCLPAHAQVFVCFQSSTKHSTQHTHQEVKPRLLNFLPQSPEPESSHPRRLHSPRVLPTATS